MLELVDPDEGVEALGVLVALSVFFAGVFSEPDSELVEAAGSVELVEPRLSLR